jgi:hypothetical protein
MFTTSEWQSLYYNSIKENAMKTHYSEEDILFLKNNYVSMSHREMAIAINKSYNSVQLKCSRLGLKKKIEKLEGMRFNRLTVISEVPKSDRASEGHRAYLCNCDCGTRSIYIRKAALLNGHTTSCGCRQREIAKARCVGSRLAAGEASLKHLENAYKQSAKNRDLIYNLDYEMFASITQSNCYYCNLSPKPYNLHYNRDMKIRSSTLEGGYDLDWADQQWVYINGIDRKDNALGYILYNCLPCCKMCNLAKGTMGYDAFVKWITSINTKNIIKD